MDAQRKSLISGIAGLTALLLSGCGDMYLASGYSSPYLGDFGPYYPGYAPFYGNDFIVGGARFRNQAGWHHFYGRSVGSRHFSGGRVQDGGRLQGRPAGGGRYGGGRRH